MSLQRVLETLPRDADGVYRAAHDARLSYPDDGHEVCYGLEDESFWFRHRSDCILSVVRRFPPCGAILDVGGGNGYVTRRLLDDGFEAVLLEPGPAGARTARVERGLPHVIGSTLEAVGFEDDALDAIGCFDVIEHIEDDVAFVETVRRVLRPGGLLYATVPAHTSLWSSADLTAGHFRRYDRRSVGALMRHGFELEYFTYFFGALLPPLFLLRSLPFRLGLTRRRRVLSTEAEHGTQGGASVRVLTRLLRREHDRIRRRGSQRLGTSCLWVARKA